MEDNAKLLDFVEKIKSRKPEYFADIYKTLSPKEKEDFKFTLDKALEYITHEYRSKYSENARDFKYSGKPIAPSSVKSKIKQTFNNWRAIKNSTINEKPLESEVVKLRNLISKIAKEQGLVKTSESSSSIRGFHNVKAGIEIKAEPYYHPYEEVHVEYVLSGWASPSEERKEQIKNIISNLKKEVENKGFKTERKGYNEFTVYP